MKKALFPILLIFMLALIACSSGGGSGDSSPDTGQNTVSDPGPGESKNEPGLQKFSDGDYNGLSDEEKYAVSNKLLSTLFKGLPAGDFFDFTNETTSRGLISTSNYIKDVETKLAQILVDEDDYLYEIDDTYNFDSRYLHVQYPLAMLYKYPLSLEYYEIWMAYKLVNTILFSPASELETVDYTDVQDVFYRLVNMIGESSSIRDIVYEHMISQENWRRFRSPEDNTREMMEIFLGQFIDSEVPLAAKACRNWSLTDESENYQLVIGFNENDETMNILDTTIVDCYDFYRAVSQHASLIPTITKTLVGIFFTGYTDAQKSQITDTIVSANPTTFNDLFSDIIFSREYLLKAERPKRLEEAFFNIAHRIDWFAFTNFFRYLNSQYSGSNFPSLSQMKQAPMKYKLGKPVAVPMDTLSFSYYHKSIREKLLLDIKSDEFNPDDGGWQAKFIEGGLVGDDFIDYLFLSVLSRKATQTELGELNQIFESRGYDRENKEKHKAMVVMDYMSRLAELYYLQKHG